MNKEIGEKLRKLREEKGISIIEIYNISKINRRTVYDMEMGEKHFRLPQLFRYSRAINADVFLIDKVQQYYKMENQGDMIKHFKKLRLENGMDLIKFSKLTGVSKMQCQLIESENANLSTKMLGRIMDYFDYDIEIK